MSRWASTRSARRSNWASRAAANETPEAAKALPRRWATSARKAPGRPSDSNRPWRVVPSDRAVRAAARRPVRRPSGRRASIHGRGPTSCGRGGSGSRRPAAPQGDGRGAGGSPSRVRRWSRRPASPEPAPTTPAPLSTGSVDAPAEHLVAAADAEDRGRTVEARERRSRPRSTQPGQVGHGGLGAGQDGEVGVAQGGGVLDVADARRAGSRARASKSVKLEMRGSRTTATSSVPPAAGRAGPGGQGQAVLGVEVEAVGSRAPRRAWGRRCGPPGRPGRGSAGPGRPGTC